MTRDAVAGVLIAKVIQREGGIAQVPGESWVTSFGQTPNWLQAFGLPTPKTTDEATANYRTWLVRTKLIGVCDVADVLADATIDFAVHSGHPTAIRALQRALKVKVDGAYGEETQAALDLVDRFAAGCKVIAARVRFTGRLITDDPTRHAKFAAGWNNRLAELIEALAS